MKRNLLLCGTLAIFALSVGAEALTPEQAWQRVAKSPEIRKAKGISQTSPCLCAAREGAYYVFDMGGNQGFVIAGADDLQRPLLGYSDNGSWDEDNLPPQLSWWLDGYRREIEYARTAGLATAEYNAQAGSAIAPLLTTEWDQMEPYWNLCPAYGDRHCVTGCVATAMAQIINYHKYYVGHGSHTLSGNYSTTFDYENTPIDFTLMEDKYDENSLSEACNEVAKLMLACGVGVDMGYGGYVSGAQSSAVPGALCNYMGYNPAINYQQVRENYTTSEWEQMIYDELAAGRPVYYSGTALSGGHAFVCDGYDGEGMFHINWGWSGMSNGFFALSALNPEDQGAGSYAGGYNFNQAAVFIRPGTCDIDEGEVFALKGGIAVSGKRWTFRYTPALIAEPMNTTIGYVIENENGVRIAEDVLGEFLFTNSELTTRTVNSSICEDAGVEGVCYVRPVFRTGSSEWRSVSRLARYAGSLKVTVSSGEVTEVEQLFPEYKLRVILDQTEVNCTDKESVMTLSVVNDGDNEFNEIAGLGFYVTGEDGSDFRVDFSGWQNNTNLFTHSLVVPSHGFTHVAIPFANLKVAPGSYDVYLLNSRKEQASEPGRIILTDSDVSAVEVKNDEVAAQWFTLTGIHLDGCPDTPGIYLRKTAKRCEKVVVR